MKIKKKLRLIKVVALSALLAVPASASANIALLLPQVISVSVMTVSASSACQIFVYDKNGNRVQVQTSPMATGRMTWGGGAYGCSLWSA